MHAELARELDALAGRAIRQLRILGSRRKAQVDAAAQLDVGQAGGRRRRDGADERDNALAQAAEARPGLARG